MISSHGSLRVKNQAANRIRCYCPRNELHRRSPELAIAGSAKVIEHAKKRMATISREKVELGERLYMDVNVVEREVEGIVQVLREGDEWWRVFQSRHRRAVVFHKAAFQD
jgi:hypothetical protein